MSLSWYGTLFALLFDEISRMTGLGFGVVLSRHMAACAHDGSQPRLRLLPDWLSEL